MPKKKASKSTKTKAAVRKKEMKGKELIFVLAIVLLFGIIFVWHRGQSNIVNAPVPTPEPSISVVYKCPNGDKIPATFNNAEGTVSFTLPGGEETTLPHAMSADGARYANSDESLVFWNVGDSVMIEQNGVTTYQNCATSN